MFPGYDLGETTQRIADGVFREISKYQFGIQFTSFYMPGNFVPHIRLMDEGYSRIETAMQFGLPYVVKRKVRPYDTATLNYNWQVWNTEAFSLYNGNRTAQSQWCRSGGAGCPEFSVCTGYCPISWTVTDKTENSE